MRIIDYVWVKRGQIERDPIEAEANARRAVAAFANGRGSDQHKEYMLQFVEKDANNNPTDPRGAAQLARLMANDEPVPGVEMNRKRAYMIANAVCGGGSPGNGGRFDFTVDTVDDGL
jgi:hypothetical protein